MIKLGNMLDNYQEWHVIACGAPLLLQFIRLIR